MAMPSFGRLIWFLLGIVLRLSLWRRPVNPQPLQDFPDDAAAVLELERDWLEHCWELPVRGGVR